MNVIAALICAAWWLLALLLLRNLRNVRLLSELPVPERDDWPDVAVIMPARNEAATLDAGVRSRLGDEYPGLKLVLVNDRSDDDTGAVADTSAERDRLGFLVKGRTDDAVGIKRELDIDVAFEGLSFGVRDVPLNRQ